MLDEALDALRIPMPKKFKVEVTIGDPARQRFTEAEIYTAFGVVPPAEQLPSIIHDLREAIGNEYMDARARTVFTCILNRLEQLP